jgi:phage terminase Nu1 subunit (DNA packaging protein)
MGDYLMLEPDSPVTQAAFGDLIDLSQPRISQLISAGVLTRGGTLKQWLRALYAHQAEIAAGRDGTDLTLERARLASEQADRVAMQNAVTRQELAPVMVLEEVLAKVAAEIGGMLEAIPSQLKRANAALGAADIELVEKVIAKARNAAAAAEIDLSGIDESGPDQESDSDGA